MPELNDLADYQKVAYSVGQIYGMPDANNRRPPTDGIP